MSELEIIFENDDLIAINKPIGLAVQSDQKNTDTLESWCQSRMEFYHFLNRIDQVVSGLVVIAKNIKASNSTKFIEKKYLAIVEGVVGEETTQLTHSIRKLKGKAIVDTSGKHSSLTYKKVHSLERYSIVEIHLETGRFHQIRCQFSHIGHPIKGDVKYGSRRKNKEGRGIYLHGYQLQLEHEGLPIKLEAPLPEHYTLWKHLSNKL